MTHPNRDINKGLLWNTKGLQTKKRKLGLTLKKKGNQSKTVNIPEINGTGIIKKNDVIIIDDSPKKLQACKKQKIEEIDLVKDQFQSKNENDDNLLKKSNLMKNDAGRRKSLKSSTLRTENNPWRLMVSMISSSLPNIEDYKRLPFSHQEEDTTDINKSTSKLSSESFVYQDLPKGCAECLYNQMRPLITYSPPQNTKSVLEILNDMRKSLKSGTSSHRTYLSKDESCASSPSYGNRIKYSENNRKSQPVDRFTKEKTKLSTSKNMSTVTDNFDFDSDLDHLLSSIPDDRIVSKHEKNERNQTNVYASRIENDSNSSFSLFQEPSQNKTNHGSIYSRDKNFDSRTQKNSLFSSITNNSDRQDSDRKYNSGASLKIPTKKTNRSPNNGSQSEHYHYLTKPTNSVKPFIRTRNISSPTVNTSDVYKTEYTSSTSERPELLNLSQAKSSLTYDSPSAGQQSLSRYQNIKTPTFTANKFNELASPSIQQNNRPNSSSLSKTKTPKTSLKSLFHHNNRESSSTLCRSSGSKQVQATNKFNELTSPSNNRTNSSTLSNPSASNHVITNPPKPLFGSSFRQNNQYDIPTLSVSSDSKQMKPTKPSSHSDSIKTVERQNQPRNCTTNTFNELTSPSTSRNYNSTNTNLSAIGIKRKSESLKPALTVTQKNKMIGSVNCKQRSIYGIVGNKKDSATAGLLKQCPVCQISFPLSFTKERRNEHINRCLSEQIVLDDDDDNDDALFEDMELI